MQKIYTIELFKKEKGELITVSVSTASINYMFYMVNYYLESCRDIRVYVKTAHQMYEQGHDYDKKFWIARPKDGFEKFKKEMFAYLFGVTMQKGELNEQKYVL